MADAVVEMQARWDGRQLRSGLQTASQQVTSFRQRVGAATAFLRGPLGFLGVGLAVSDVIKRLRDLGEEERQLNRLVATAKRFGGTRVDIMGLNAALVELRRNSLYGDTELTAALAKLTQTTRDYNESLKNLSLVADVAAATNKSLEESAKLVGFAMKGILEPLGEIDPQIRLWAMANRDLIGTSEGAAKAIEMLRDAVGGASKAEAETGLAGAFKLAKEGWDEFIDSLMERHGILERVLRTFGEAADLAAENNRRANAVQNYYSQNGANPLGGAQANSMLASGMALLPIPPTGYGQPQMFTPYGPDLESMQAWAKERDARNAKAAASAWQLQMGRSEMVGGLTPWQSSSEVVHGAVKMRGALGDVNEFWREQNEQSEEAYKQFEERRKKEAAQIMALGAELQNSLTGAFYAAFDGVDALGDYIKQKLMGEVLTNLGAAIANIFLPGSGSFTPFGKAIGLGGGGGASSSASYGLRGAQTAQASYRMVRRG